MENKQLDEVAILEWVKCQGELKKLKAREMNLRKTIVKVITNNAAIKTKTAELFGFELKAENKISFSIDKDLLLVLRPQLSFAEQESLKWTPSVVAKNYKALAPATLLKSQIVTLKEAAPGLTLVSQLD